MHEYWFIFLALRVIVPLIIIRWPFMGILLSSLVDAYDWKFYPFESGGWYEGYRKWDKILDLYYLGIAAFVSLSFKDSIMKRLLVGTYLWRIIGVFIYWFFNMQFILLLFPNIFELLFAFYVAFKKFTKQEILITSWKVFLVIVLSILIPKLIHEYLLNVLVKQPWELFDIAGILGANGVAQEYINYAIWGSIIHGAPIIVLIWYINRARTRKLV
jgi:hypothetical protein